ncbi:hypothetical protein LCGC14_2351940, partial [marine sediment metagenome]
LHGYLLLAEQLFNHGQNYAQAWNFGPLAEGEQMVSWIADFFAQRWPTFTWSTNDQLQPHEANILKLDCTKAHEYLGWSPSWSLAQSLDQIDKWYKHFDNNDNMKLVCLEQIRLLTNTAEH